MAAAGLAVGRSVPEAEVERVLGIDVVHKLKAITAALYKNVDEDLVSLRARHDELRAGIKQIYPKHKVIQVVFDTGAA